MSWEVLTMRSATSFFNGAIARSDLRRYWPVLFLYVGLWLIFLPIPVWNRAAERNPALVNLTELCADTYATAVVLVPVICRQSFGTREYSVIYSRVSTVFNLIAAFAAMIWAWLGSSFGFTVEFIVALAMLVVILLLGLYIFKAAAGYKKDWTTE